MEASQCPALGLQNLLSLSGAQPPSLVPRALGLLFPRRGSAAGLGLLASLNSSFPLPMAGWGPWAWLRPLWPQCEGRAGGDRVGVFKINRPQETNGAGPGR